MGKTRKTQSSYFPILASGCSDTMPQIKWEVAELSRLVLFPMPRQYLTKSKHIFVEEVNDLESNIQSYNHIVFISRTNITTRFSMKTLMRLF